MTTRTTRTIDNLGIEASIRYAEDKKEFDESMITEARFIPGQAGIAVMLPSHPSEYDLMFETGRRNQTWANFPRHPTFADLLRRPFFSYQLIPSLGSEDKREAQVDRIKTRVALDREKNLIGKEEEKQQSILLNFYEKIHILERYLIDSNSSRTQYQKG